MKTNRGLYFLLGIMIATGSGYCFGKTNGEIQLTDSWKDAKGEYFLEKFQLQNGKTLDGYSPSVTSKEGWSFIWNNNTYLLYQINTSNSEKPLNIGLLDSKGEIINKYCLIASVENVSKVKISSEGKPFVSANLADGTETNIFIRFPKPFEPLPDIKDNAEAYLSACEDRIYSRVYGDYPLGCDWQDAVNLRFSSNIKNELFDIEKRKVLDVHIAMFPEERKSVKDKLNVLNSVRYSMSDVLELNNQNDDFISTSHAALDEYVLQEAMDHCWDNWLKSLKYPDGWRKVRNARGVFRGKTFVAKEGLVLIRVKEKYSYTFLILKLSPKQYREEFCYNPVDWSSDYVEKIGFELIDPNAQERSYLPETGDFILKDGIWVENSLGGNNVEPSKNFIILEQF